LRRAASITRPIPQARQAATRVSCAAPVRPAAGQGSQISASASTRVTRPRAWIGKQGKREAVLASRQAEPVRPDPQIKRIRERIDRHPLPSLQQAEFRHSSGDRDTFARAAFGANEQRAASVRVRYAHDSAGRHGVKRQLAVIGQRLDRRKLGWRGNSGNSPRGPIPRQRQRHALGQRQTDHGAGSHGFCRGCSKHRIAAQRAEVHSAPLI